MNPIEKTILERGKDPTIAFVFPSDIAASLWIQKALSITGAKTLPTERFIAWDRFKESSIKSTVAGKSPVSAVIRKLYALNLAERNARAEKPFLSSIIPTAHAGDGSLFAPWIARILPQLALWNYRQKNAPSSARGKNAGAQLDFFDSDQSGGEGLAAEAESRDLAFIHADYAKFLEAHALFEPAWQRPPLPKTKFDYVIFYPELMEDFGDFEEIIRKTPGISLVPIAEADDGGARETRVYADTRQEIIAVAIEIGRLIEGGMKPEDIAISVPDIETVAPYVLRELRLRDIDCEYRAGAPISNLPGGKIFSLMQNCVSADYSFASVKALILDRLIPWKNRKLAEELISFGIRNHCVTSWNENGKRIDIWEEAFKAPAKGDASDWRLREYYRELKAHLNPLVKAASFADCRNAWFSFREKFLDMEALGGEDDAVIARAVAELNALASLDAKYHEYMPAKPFAFFVSHLGEKKYVAQKIPGGVSVFPYRVAAGTPFARHFVIDASQKSVAVSYRQLGFLRQDRRLALGLSDTDASDSFLAAYRAAGGIFSCANRSYAGYRMPHGYFTAEIAPKSRDEDPYAEERTGRATGTIPERMYGAQKDGFRAWNAFDRRRKLSYLETPLGEIADESCKARIRELVDSVQKKDGNYLVTQTALNTFAECNARWFLGSILGIEAPASDAELMNERNLGLLYHGVLKDLYAWIRETGPAFNAERIEDYRAKAEEIAAKAALAHSEFQGPLAAPIIDALIRKIANGVSAMLEADAKDLNGFIPDFLEDEMALTQEGVRYYGRIDRVSKDPAEGTLVLVDYKSGRVPTAAECIGDETTGISDFQMQTYIFLAENSPNSPYKGKKIEHAWFGNIKGRKFAQIVEDGTLKKATKKSAFIARDQFDKSMQAFRDETARFVESIRDLDFRRPEKLSPTVCESCDFKALCRYTFSVMP